MTGRFITIVLLVLSFLVFAVYAATAHRTIDWWFGSSYPLAAVTLGVHFPPGSLLLTLLGWLVTRLPVGLSKAFMLNLFCGVLGALTFYLLAALAVRLMNRRSIEYVNTDEGASPIIATVGIGLGLLVFAFSEAAWRYSIIFMPYIVTALFTVLILWAMAIWWRHDSIAQQNRWLFVVMLLFGLDLSVHRTNALLLPGFLLWIVLYRRSIFARLGSWIAGIAGLAAGLAFHLLIIPLAARGPILNANDPSSLSRFYYYVSLRQYGGSWLLDMWPRNASFIGVQVADYFHVLRGNFLSGRRFIAIVTLVIFHIGMVAMLRRRRTMAIGLLIMFFFSSIGAVLYFNMPENFASPMDRHYMPSFVLFGFFLGYGAGAVLTRAWHISSRFRAVAVPLVFLVLLALPGMLLVRNYNRMNGSSKYFAHDYAMNVLSSLRPDAILFMTGDHYVPLLYMQAVEGVRPDVTILSTSLMNTGWYVEQALQRYPDLPLTLTESDIARIEPKPWKEARIVTEVDATPESFGFVDTESISDTFYLHVKPTVADHFLFVHEWLLVRLITESKWRRPLYFNSPPACVSRYARLEGLVSRLVPRELPEVNREVLRQNLLERYRYRGYDDESIALARYTRDIGHALYRAFHALARVEMKSGNVAACQDIKRKLVELIPLERIDPPPELRLEHEELCNSE